MFRIHQERNPPCDCTAHGQQGNGCQQPQMDPGEYCGFRAGPRLRNQFRNVNGEQGKICGIRGTCQWLNNF